LKAEKEFNAYANGGSDPASAFEDFLKARDRFKADAGARAESLVPDDGIMGTRYLESLLTSSNKDLRMCGKAVVEVFTAQESAAAISGSASPMPVRTLKMVHDVTVLQWTRLVSDKVVGSGRGGGEGGGASSVDSSQGKTHKHPKKKQDGVDGPNQSAHNAQVVTANTVKCFICGKPHRMRGMGASGNRFHSAKEVEDHYQTLKGAKETDQVVKATGKPSFQSDKPKGKGGKGSYNQGGKGYGKGVKDPARSNRGHSSGGAHQVDEIAQVLIEAADAEAEMF
jgi:hypothetical protein